MVGQPDIVQVAEHKSEDIIGIALNAEDASGSNLEYSGIIIEVK